MLKNRTGWVLAVLGALWIVAMSGIASWSVSPTFRRLSVQELQQTVWGFHNIWIWLWAFSGSLGSLMITIGLMMALGVARKAIWSSGLVMFFAIYIATVLLRNVYLPPLFGVGGIVIILCAFAIFAFWAAHYDDLEAPLKKAALWQLVGYAFFLMGMWTLCGDSGSAHTKALMDQPANPTDVMVFFVLGWICHLVYFYYSRKSKS